MSTLVPTFEQLFENTLQLLLYWYKRYERGVDYGRQEKEVKYKCYL